MQSDDFSDDCSGENVNVEGHVAIDNGNSGEGDVSTFSMLGCNSVHIRLTNAQRTSPTGYDALRRNS